MHPNQSWFLGITLGAVVFLAGCGHNRAQDPRVDIIPPIGVTVEHPHRGTIFHTLTLPGDVVGLQEAKLYAKVSGYLKAVYVDKGDVVRAGQLLATIDSPELAREVAHEHQSYLAAIENLHSGSAELGKAQAEAQGADAQVHRSMARVEQARADILKAQGDLQLARATYMRLKKVYDADHGLISKQDLDVAEAGLESAKAKLTAAQRGLDAAKEEVNAQRGQRVAATSNVAALRARLTQSDAQSRAVGESEKLAKDLLNYTEIRAPFAGVITGRFLDPGALVQSAANNAQETTHPVLSLVNSDVVRIFVQTPEPDVPLVRPGTPLEVHVDELPLDVFKGTITRISGALDNATRTMLSECDLVNHRHLLKPGMMVKASLYLERHANALTVPSSAIVMDGQKRTVYVVDGSKARKVSITTGFEEPSRVEVVSGLHGDESVIVAGKESVNDGTVVRAVVPPTPQPQISSTR